MTRLIFQMKFGLVFHERKIWTSKKDESPWHEDIDVGDKCVGDKLKMLLSDLKHWKNHQHNEKSRQHNDSVTDILNRSPS